MRINLTERTIALTKKEMTAASRYGSDAYKELQNARRDNPGFEIVTITRMVKTQRETYKGLTYEYMEKYIKTHDDEKGTIWREYKICRGKPLALMDAGAYTEAIAAFEALEGYKDSDAKIGECNNAILDGKYNSAVALVDAGKYGEAAIEFYRLGYYRDAINQSFAVWDKIAVRPPISAGDNHTVALKSDGTVVAVGDNDYGQCTVSRWKNIVAVSASNSFSIGLRSDGTVVSAGNNYSGQCNVSNWTNIVAISAGTNQTVGLKADGTVVATGSNNHGECNVSNWTAVYPVGNNGLQWI